jgi:hypothetical protein
MIDHKYMIPKKDEQRLKEAEKAESARREMKKNKRGQFKKGHKNHGGGRPKQYG